MGHRSILSLLFRVIAMMAFCGPAHAVDLLSEDFEDPDVADYSQGTRPAGWVGATAGYHAGYHGITDKAGGDFSAADPNHQAYAFRYSSNAGVTSGAGEIDILRDGVTYSASFDVVRDDGRSDANDLNYDAKLIAFADGAVRTDCTSTPAGSLEIAAATGSAPTDGTFQTVSFSITGDAVTHAGYLGLDLGIRFRGSYDSALIDNVVITSDLDVVPPQVASLNPTNGAVDAALDADLVAFFDEDIVGASGTVVITNMTDQTAAVMPIGDPQISISSSVLTVNASLDLLPGKTYAVLIETNAIRDEWVSYFAGITNTTTWRFNTAATDTVDPVLNDVSPADGTTVVAPGADLVATFSEPVVLVSNGVITVTNLTAGTAMSITLPAPSQVTVSGAVVTVDLASDLSVNSTYAVLIDSNAVADVVSNRFAGVLSTNAWRFDTAGPPNVHLNGGADEIGVGTAQLRGALNDGDSAEVYFCWGTTDGGTGSTGDWQNVVAMGVSTEPDVFKETLNGLLYGVPYIYRAYATNSYGDDWSNNPDEFTTLPPGGGGGTPVAGAYFEWDAAQDPGPGATWPSTTANPYDWTFDAGSQVATDVADPRFDAVTKSFGFPECKDGQNTAWDGFGSAEKATFELVLDVDGDDGVVFESGGSGDGIMIDVAAGNLRALVEEDPTDAVVSYPLTATDKGRFIHAVVVADNTDGIDVLELYVDGVQQDSVPWAAGDDWSGGNEGGLGARYDSVVDGGSTVDFDGKIALFRYYRNTAFGTSQVSQNFNALSASALGISNSNAVNVAETTADLLGTLDAPGSVFTVYAHYSTNTANTNAAAWLADASALSVEVGTYTNVSGQSVTGSVSGLTGETTYYYTMSASNAVTNIWATPNQSFTTLLTEFDPPAIVSLNPTNMQTGVIETNSLVAIFDEVIYLVDGGIITLTNLTAGTSTNITLPNAQLSVVGSNLTINPASDLDIAATYAVLVNGAAIRDVFNNEFPGIADTSTWQFTVSGLPTLASVDIVDDQGGGPVVEDELVTYTVTFSEDMDAGTVTAGDFGNAGDATIVLGAVTETAPGVFEVEVTPTTAGTLTLQILAGAVLRDHTGNAMDTASAILDDTTITVQVETVPPTLAPGDIADNVGGGPIFFDETVTYTLTFSEDMDASTVSTDDFGNAGDARIRFGDVSEVSPGVFTVDVTPTTTGLLQFAVAAGASLLDTSGNALDTTSNIVDNTSITVEYGRIIFSEDFEIPDTPTAYSQGTTPQGWVRATQGYRSSYHGITDKAGNDFSAPDPNQQAYAFRYTNSGFTTDEDEVADFAEGVTYTVVFHVVRDGGGNSGTPYTAQLIAFAEGAARNDCRSTPGGSSVVASAGGNAPSDGTFRRVSMRVTADAIAHASYLDYDLGVRFRGATTSAIIDNVVVYDDVVVIIPGTTLIIR